jgi:hypothetical protein
MKNFAFAILTILLFCPATHASIIGYSLTGIDGNDVNHRLLTPDNDYDVNLSGYIYIESDPTINYVGSNQSVQYIYNIDSFALDYYISDINESLFFEGYNDSYIEITVAANSGTGDIGLFRRLVLSGSGNFENLVYSDFLIDNSFSGELLESLVINDGFYGTNMFDQCIVSIIGKDDWFFMSQAVKLTTTPVPEPSTVILLSLGIFVFLLKRKFS